MHRKAARFVKQEYAKYCSVTRMVHELGWKKLQDITINHAVQNNRQNSNCTTQRNTNCQQIPVLEANMDINEYKYSFLKKCEAVDAFKHG